MKSNNNIDNMKYMNKLCEAHSFTGYFSRYMAL